MEVKVSIVNGSVPVTVMEVHGNIDSSSYVKFQSTAEQAIAEGTRHILIDLSHAPFVSSSGLRALHAIFNQLRSLDAAGGMSDEQVRQGINAGTYKSPHLKLTNLSRETRTTFELSGFDMFIETFDSRDTALASFGSRS